MGVVAGHHEICVKVAEALGIKHCRKIDIRMRLKEIVTVTVEFFPEEDQILALVPILREFELHEKKAGKE